MAVIVGAGLALIIAVAAFVYLSGRGGAPGVVGRVLRLLAVAATVGIAVVLLPSTVEDSGAAAAYLLGVPVAAAACALAADLTRRAVGITTTITALVMLVWGLLLGLGVGGWFILPALLFGISVVAAVPLRRRVPAARIRGCGGAVRRSGSRCATARRPRSRR